MQRLWCAKQPMKIFKGVIKIKVRPLKELPQQQKETKKKLSKRPDLEKVTLVLRSSAFY